MATIQVAIRAIFEGKSQVQDAAKSLGRVREELDKLDKKGATAGEELLTRLQAIQANAAQVAEGGTFQNIEALATALKRTGAEATLAAAGAAQLGNVMRALEFSNEAAQAEALAQKLIKIRNSITEVGTAVQTLSRADVVNAIRGTGGIEQTGQELNRLRQNILQLGIDSLRAGNNVKLLEQDVKNLGTVSAVAAEVVAAFEKMGASSAEIVKLGLELNNIKNIRDEFAGKFGTIKVAPENLDQEIALWEKYAQVLANTAAQQAAMGNKGATQALQSQASGAEAYASSLRKIQDGLKGVQKEAEKLTRGDLFGMVKGKKDIDQMRSALEKEETVLRRVAKRFFEAGDAAKGLVASSKADQIREFRRELTKAALAAETNKAKIISLTKQLGELSQSHRSSTQSMGLWLKQLNLIGFSIFITISSIKTLLGLLTDAGGAFLQFGEAATLMQSFNIMMTKSGVAGQEMAAGLNEAGRGLLSIEKTQRSTLRLLKAGVPEFEKTTLMLARLASNAAIVSGEVSDVNMIYDKLVRGIVRGSPRLIDDTDVVLKLGNAYEKYAETIGKAKDELTEAEQQLAVVEALEIEAERMELLAAAIGDTPIEPLQRAATNMRNIGTEAKRTAGVIVNEFVAAIVEANSAGKELRSVDQIMEDVAAEARASEMRIDAFRAALERAAESGDFGEAEETLSEFIMTLDPATQAVITFGAGAAVLGQIIDAIVRGPFATFMNLFLQVPYLIGIFIGSVVKSIKPLELLGNSFDELKIKAELFWLAITGKAGGERFKELTEELKITIAEGFTGILDFAVSEMEEGVIEIVETAAGGVDHLRGVFSRANIMDIWIEQLRSQGIDVREELNETFDAVSQDTLKWLQEQVTSLDEILGAQGKFARSSAKVWRDYSEQIFEINQNLTESLLDLWNDKLEKIEDAHEKFGERIEDINEASQDKLDKIAKDARKKEEKENERFKDQKEKDETKHQDKMEQIRRRFELARLKALIDRDARALFEAQLKRDEDLRNAKEDAKKKKEERKKDHQDRLDDIRANEKERADEERAAAEKRRIDAAEDRDKELQDIEEWYWDQSDAQQKAAERRRKQAKLSAERRIRDLEESLKETEMLEAASALKRRLTEAIELAKREGNTRDFANNLKAIVTDLQHFFDNTVLNFPTINMDFGTGEIITGGTGGPGGAPLPPGTIPGGGGPPSGGTGPNCIPTLSFKPVPGLACDSVKYAGGKQIAPDCTRWRCWPTEKGYIWVRDMASVGSSAPQSLAPGETSTGDVSGVEGHFTPQFGFAQPQGAGGNGQTSVPVTIITNDESMGNYLEEVSASAFAEIISIGPGH